MDLLTGAFYAGNVRESSISSLVMSSSQQPPATHPFPAKHHMDLVVTKKVNNGRAERFYGNEKNMEISSV